MAFGCDCGWLRHLHGHWHLDSEGPEWGSGASVAVGTSSCPPIMGCKTYRWNGETTTYLRHLEYFCLCTVIHVIYIITVVFLKHGQQICFCVDSSRYLNIEFRLQQYLLTSHEHQHDPIGFDVMPQKNTTSQPWGKSLILGEKSEISKNSLAPLTFICVIRLNAKDKVTVGDYDLISYAHNKNCKAFSSNFLAGRKCLGFAKEMDDGDGPSTTVADTDTVLLFH